MLLALLTPALAQKAPSPAPSMNPDLALIADVAAAYFTSEEPLQSGGHDPTQNGFNLQQLELSAQSVVDPYFDFNANIVFSLYGVEIEEVYATTRALPGRTQLRAGQFLTRFGRANNSHPHAWDFVDQSFVIGRVLGSEGNRGLGVEGSVLLPVPWFAELSVAETMAGGEATARSFYGGEDLGVDSPLHLQSTVALKQFHPLGHDHSFFWGLSFASGPNPSGRRNRSELYGLDLFYKFRRIQQASNGWFTAQAELIHRRRQIPADVLADWNAYGQLTWRLARRWALAGRQEWGSPARTLDGELAVEADTLDPEWTADRHRSSLNASFWPSEFSRLRLQGAADLAGWRESPDWSVFLAFEFAVGAHGAHAY